MKGPLIPTPDIDIGELRRLEKVANDPRWHGNLIGLTVFELADYRAAQASYETALRNAAPALLAAAEEGAAWKAQCERQARDIELLAAQLADLAERHSAALAVVSAAKDLRAIVDRNATGIHTADEQTCEVCARFFRFDHALSTYEGKSET